MRPRPIPAAVLQDGQITAIILVGPDRRHIPDGALSLVAELRPEFIKLTGPACPDLHVDLEAELDLRDAAEVILVSAEASGFSRMRVALSIDWSGVRPPSLRVRRGGIPGKAVATTTG